ncbi:RHS repeat-associated core domain-containing protein [Leptospira sp. 2 VSF19]|uniref:RHS repeat-associated core domain-containing protein n=1 Tax=Leptospira soteropolitanensis TaxID=2950025 RepID=A0AAW5VA75_9LEPT|nr:RHS repeat-associated core domain-containing protein [Leptospira soteropolitanensis]MCW7492376.1 RHS repeat-associated core domain-containing protein [Leptospira soteropolitanensis]MCW7499957.1 RHS repeat-associated core domain-containing protein [Leptospira soteropolitanensis]MCW7522208.1 RHS repeat-associated core domain-containing protein [Leptospira soteropolitanensis]MCW7526063.1 RHS repeat-associated core domain-containing protein [Leptospira soteropolitanensis]MCW7529824.1 RHS repeat
MFGTRPTLYVIGAEGDMVAQYSRGDAILLNQMASNDWLVNPFCKDVNIDCDTYWKNRVGFLFIKTLEDTNIYMDGKLREGHRGLPWVVLLGFLFWVVYKTKDQAEEVNVEMTTFDLFGISLLPSLTNKIQKQVPRYGTALLVVVFSFTTTSGCFPLLLGGGEAESGTPIWLLGLGNGIPADTQSVADEPGQGGSGGGGTSTGNARVEGMYFFHPDHLGSITMITDGHGNVLAGGERGGKSHITYKPYGEIFRTDSYGPDITKFKYTGQEEDQESGLYYYKARYYDAALGRFVSNDGMVFPDKEQGMNRMMYVEGNPVAFVDPSGNNKHIHMLNRIIGHAMGKDFGGQGINKIGKNISTGINKAAVRNTMWVSDRLSIRRHVKYIAREGAEKGIGHREERFKDYAKEYIKDRWKSLEAKVFSAWFSKQDVKFEQNDFEIDAEDFLSGFVQSEIRYYAGLTIGSRLGGDILTNIKDNPWDIFKYYQRYRKFRETEKTIENVGLMNSIYEIGRRNHR